LRKHQIPTPASLIDANFSILIVDDEEDLTEMLKTYFQRQGGYDVSTASDGITALMEVGRLKPDLLILDIMIPGFDGVEVCRRIKETSGNRTAIIAISGVDSNQTRILQAGADAFMLKPVDLEKLRTEARRLLRIL